MFFRTAALLFVATVAAGCEFTPPGRPSDDLETVVEGTILLDGSPLPNGGRGWVTFFPEGSSQGDVAVCRLNADGSYRCDHVVVGPVNVRIDVAPSVAANIPPIIRRRIMTLRGPTSPLRSTTTAGAVTRFDFDLLHSPDPPRT
jgi:hypothetical protein